MLSNITSLWPPRPGPDQPQTGTKTLHPVISNKLSESLKDLHEPAWWSGVKFSAATAESRVSDAYFRVRLVNALGLPVFDAAPDRCEWVQPVGVWRSFPWPIPAAMAAAMDIRIEATLMDHAYDTYIGLTLCFHELPLMPPRDRYLFVDAQGHALHQWNGTEGSPWRGAPPEWRTIHRVVYPSSLLTTQMDNTLFCIHDWNETV